MAKAKAMTMSEEIQGWGIGFLFLGFLHFVVPLLSPEWGVILIISGILLLVIRHRGMFIVLGVSLILVGILNIIGSIEVGESFWMIFGGFQIFYENIASDLRKLIQLAFKILELINAKRAK